MYTNGKNYSPSGGQINSFDLLCLFEGPSELLVNEANHGRLLSPPRQCDDGGDAASKVKSIENVFKAKANDYLTKLTRESSEFVGTKRADIHSLFKTSQIDDYLIDLVKFFVHVYRDLQIPIRFYLQNPAAGLNQNESMRIEARAYLPSKKEFINVS